MGEGHYDVAFPYTRALWNDGLRPYTSDIRKFQGQDQPKAEKYFYEVRAQEGWERILSAPWESIQTAIRPPVCAHSIAGICRLTGRDPILTYYKFPKQLD